jgi:hypothetical protein
MGGTLVVTLKLARAGKWFDVVREQRKHLATTNCQVFFHHFWWFILMAAIEHRAPVHQMKGQEA